MPEVAVDGDIFKGQHPDNDTPNLVMPNGDKLSLRRDDPNTFTFFYAVVRVMDCT
jgi:hypothetical protein